ncbi:Os05g0166750, partial [Oryza sativa Japonica Group]
AAAAVACRARPAAGRSGGLPLPLLLPFPVDDVVAATGLPTPLPALPSANRWAPPVSGRRERKEVKWREKGIRKEKKYKKNSMSLST